MEFENMYLKCRMDFMDDCRYIKITGIFLNRSMYKNILIVAPNSAPKTASYSGTGLPFPSADVAFEGSKNLYVVDLSGNIDAIFTYPNSYYTAAATKKIVSSVFVIIEDLQGNTNFVRLELKDLYPLRTLVDREERTGPEFYDLKHEILPIDSADAVMQAYATAKIKYRLA